MTPRERVRKALSHMEADRVPIDNGGIVSGMHNIAYRNLLDYLGMDDEIIIYDYIQRIVIVKDEVLDLFGVDTRYLYSNAPSFWKYQEKSDGSWVDEFGTGYTRSEFYCDYSSPVLKDASLEEIKKYKFPDPRDAARFEGLREKAKNLYNKTDYALVGGPIPTLFALAWILRGMEQFMIDIAINKSLAEYLLDKILEWQIDFLDAFLDEVGDIIEYQWLGDDWGEQNGPIIAPAMFRDMVVPRLKKMIDFVNHKTQAKISYHTCGATYWVMKDLVDMGVDIVHPLQANAAGNKDAARLKNDFGKGMVFHGNTNNQGVFHKSKDEVKADVLYRIKHLAPGGGYIFSSGHNIQANMPPENILVLFETAREYGTYPIDVARIDKELEKLRNKNPHLQIAI